MWRAVGLHPRGKGSFSQVSKVLWQASAHACTAHADPDSTTPASAHGKLHVVLCYGFIYRNRRGLFLCLHKGRVIAIFIQKHRN